MTGDNALRDLCRQLFSDLADETNFDHQADAPRQAVLRRPGVSPEDSSKAPSP